jgi:hypothetical protein
VADDGQARAAPRASSCSVIGPPFGRRPRCVHDLRSVPDKDQPELRQASGEAEVTSITRNTTFAGGPPGTRTRNLRIRSLVGRCRSQS